MNDRDKESLSLWIARLAKYGDDYADALTWGGPTIYPESPLDQNSSWGLSKLLERIMTEHTDALGADQPTDIIKPIKPLKHVPIRELVKEAHALAEEARIAWNERRCFNGYGSITNLADHIESLFNDHDDEPGKPKPWETNK